MSMICCQSMRSSFSRWSGS